MKLQNNCTWKTTELSRWNQCINGHLCWKSECQAFSGYILYQVSLGAQSIVDDMVAYDWFTTQSGWIPLTLKYGCWVSLISVLLAKLFGCYLGKASKIVQEKCSVSSENRRLGCINTHYCSISIQFWLVGLFIQADAMEVARFTPQGFTTIRPY